MYFRWNVFQKHRIINLMLAYLFTHPDSSWPATYVSYNVVPMWLLLVLSTIQDTMGYSAATGCKVTFATEASALPHSTL